MEIGSKGLAEVKLIIPQETSLAFSVVYQDNEGNVIDVSESSVYMAFQTRDRRTTYDMTTFCNPTSESIDVVIPPSATENMLLGKMNWDLIIETQMGDVVRLCYGIAEIVDTYALDEV